MWRSRPTQNCSACCAHLVPPLLSCPSGCLPVVVVQHPTQPLAARDRSTIPNMELIRDDQPVAEALVVALTMIMCHEFANRLPQRAFSE